jgi:hypothetical protein
MLKVNFEVFINFCARLPRIFHGKIFSTFFSLLVSKQKREKHYESN